ncbi:MAG: helix-turn-helix domain-containing protein [Anaerostipes hadrus]|nr:helix-turn-helix domain-containing protein [Anaerostipes hadrus]
MTIYERIESLRKSKGLSQGKLEKQLGFSNASISKWKNSTPKVERLQKLADFFGVSVEYLMTGKEDEQKGKDNTDDLKQKFEELKELLENGKMQPLRYDGQPIDDNTKELLLKQVEISMAMMKK